MAINNVHRITLTLYDDDFRQREVLALLRERPRNMTEFIVNAVCHYVRCPNAGNDSLDRAFIKGVVQEVIAEMAENGELELTGSGSPRKEAEPDLSELGGIMSMFRGG